ncbi:MAG: hypothetical protein KDD01_01460 [Phaeodactylibacter sp.]|nr:hypothetical protein [Phaeodactylibacter sp.]
MKVGLVVFLSCFLANIQHIKLMGWLSLNQLVVLFERDKSVLSRHIRNVFQEGELERDSVVAKFATTAGDGKT